MLLNLAQWVFKGCLWRFVVFTQKHPPTILIRSFKVLLEQALCSSSVQCSWEDMFLVKIALQKVPIGDDKNIKSGLRQCLWYMLVKKTKQKKQSTHESPIEKRKNLFVSKASATFIGRLRCGDMQVDGWMDRRRRFEQVCMTYIFCY